MKGGAWVCVYVYASCAETLLFFIIWKVFLFAFSPSHYTFSFKHLILVLIYKKDV